MPAVTLITLGVRDLARAEAFYVAWGWTRSSESVDGAVTFFRDGPVVLGLFGWDALAEDAAVSPVGEGFRGVSLAQNLATRDEVDERFAAGLAAGGAAVKEPEEVFWGGYSGYLADPDGHLWEIANNPGWPLRDDGGVDLPA